MRRIDLRAWAAALALALPWAAGALDNPYPSTAVVSPGVKLGWTFGPGGGFTYGFELSVSSRLGAGLSPIVGGGGVADFTWSSGGLFQAHLGVEAISWFVGAEAGPTLVWDEKNEVRFGVGVTPWASFIFVDPYYTYLWVKGAESRHELGVYLKLPLLPGEAGGGGGGVLGGSHHHFHCC